MLDSVCEPQISAPRRALFHLNRASAPLARALTKLARLGKAERAEARCPFLARSRQA
jgi:hypothetical protein